MSMLDSGTIAGIRKRRRSTGSSVRGVKRQASAVQDGNQELDYEPNCEQLLITPAHSPSTFATTSAQGNSGSNELSRLIRGSVTPPHQHHSGHNSCRSPAPRWPDTLEDVSLSGFDLASPNYQEILKFVDRQSSVQDATAVEAASSLLNVTSRLAASAAAANSSDNKPVWPVQSKSPLNQFAPPPTTPALTNSRPATAALGADNLLGKSPTYNVFRRFQFCLMAQTSAAVPLNHEALTYLNQGQSYQVICKRLGPSKDNQSRYYRTTVKIRFHSSRQKYEERRLMAEWVRVHQNRQPVEGDAPLSVNVWHLKNTPDEVEFVWDPLKTCSVYVKLNCLSTEFTAKKHGGEKGVPFRLVITTYTYDDSRTKLHSCYAQIRVFKLKGADRRNRMDRDKAAKRMDKERFQPAYEYTMMIETFPTNVSDLEVGRESPETMQIQLSTSPVESVFADDKSGDGYSVASVAPSVCNGAIEPVNTECKDQALPSTATTADVAAWLRANRFGHCLELFDNYTGLDLNRLGRAELASVMRNEADALRLYNAMHAKPPRPFKTLLFRPRDAQSASNSDENSQGSPPVQSFSCVYLSSSSLDALKLSLCSLVEHKTKPKRILWHRYDDVWANVEQQVMVNWADESAFDYSWDQRTNTVLLHDVADRGDQR